MNLRSAKLLILLAVTVACDPATADSLDETTPDARQSTVQERRAVRTLQGKYRRARRDLDAKRLVVQEAIGLGPAVVEAMLPLIDAELQPQLTRYRQQFYKSAQAAAIKKFQQANLEEVAQLRSRVNALRENDNLTKQMIVEQGDPAMQRLERLLILERDTVLTSNRRLMEQREAMAGIGALWQLCQAYLASTSPTEEGQSSPPMSFEEYLQQEETLAVRLALPMSDNTRSVLAANAKLADRLAAEEARCVLALNLTRILLGLEPVVIDLALTAAARGHSADMREHNFFSHDSPLPGKATPWDRAKLAGTTASGENIAVGPRAGTAANLMWFHSPGHHRNMLGDHQRVGVGLDGNYWTELFGR